MEISVSKDDAQTGELSPAEFKISCPKCGQHIAVSSELTGMNANCPSCQTPFTVTPPPSESHTAPSPRTEDPHNPTTSKLDSDHASVFGMEDAEKINVGAAVKDTFKVLRSNAGVFKSLNYGFLIPFSKIFSAEMFRKKAVRWVLFLGLTPLAIYLSVGSFELSYHTTLWLFQIYFCCFWALYFYSLIQPSKAIWRRAIGYAMFTVIIGIPIDLFAQRLPVLSQLYSGAESEHFVARLLSFIFGVGVLEETCKALPLLLFGLRNNKINGIRDGLFLGFVSGLGFAASEGVSYSFGFGHAADLGYVSAGDQNLQLIFRMMSNPILHGAWAGTVGWFIGVASNKTLRWPIIVIGILFMAILHGLNDVFSANILHLIIAGISIVIFMAYMLHGEEDRAEETKVASTTPISET